MPVATAVIDIRVTREKRRSLLHDSGWRGGGAIGPTRYFLGTKDLTACDQAWNRPIRVSLICAQCFWGNPSRRRNLPALSLKKMTKMRKPTSSSCRSRAPTRSRPSGRVAPSTSLELPARCPLLPRADSHGSRAEAEANAGGLHLHAATGWPRNSLPRMQPDPLN